MPGFSPPERATAAALVLTLALSSATAFAAGQVGEVAAPFTLDSLDHGSVSLSDYAGQVVLLSVIGYG